MIKADKFSSKAFTYCVDYISEKNPLVSDSYPI